MASEGTIPRLNVSIIPEAAFSFSWESNQRTSAPGRDVRTSRQSRPYWEGELSNLLVDELQKNNLLAMSVRQRGQWRPVLVRVTPFCELGTFDDRDGAGEPIVTPASLGVCTVAGQSFQLTKPMVLEGYESEDPFLFIVRKPQWDYPLQKQIGRTIAGYIYYEPMPEVQVYAGGVALTPFSQFTVDKENGLVTSQVTGTLTVTGGFYVPMLLPNKIQFTAEGELYRVSSAVSMVEPPGFGG